MSFIIFRDPDDADRHRECIKEQLTIYGGLGWWIRRGGSINDITHHPFHSIAIYLETGERLLDFNVTCAEYGYTVDDMKKRKRLGITATFVANEILTRPILVVGEAWSREKGESPVSL